MNDVNLNPETQTDVSKLEVLIGRQQLQERIRELGQIISEDYKNKAVSYTHLTLPTILRV